MPKTTHDAEHIRTCWQWDHTCFAKRLRGRGTRSKPRKATAPATIAGRIVPNVALAVAA